MKEIRCCLQNHHYYHHYQNIRTLFMKFYCEKIKFWTLLIK